VGVLGMLGLTAYAGMVLQCEPKPGGTAVVSAASGGVGQIAGQIARLKGCRVVGIAGREEKCRYLVEELGFDACISRLSPNFAQDLKAACPGGIDIYFENVGGVVFEGVLPLFKPGARMTICGLIAHYGDAPGVDARALERDRAEARGVHVRNLAVGEYAADWHNVFLARWHPGSLLARSVTAKISATDLRSSPPPLPRCCAARTSARPWSASRRIRLSHRNVANRVSIEPSREGHAAAT
jgi:NADPH-dependent curcumin reductase CurA